MNFEFSENKMTKNIKFYEIIRLNFFMSVTSIWTRFSIKLKDRDDFFGQSISSDESFSDHCLETDDSIMK